MFNKFISKYGTLALLILALGLGGIYLYRKYRVAPDIRFAGLELLDADNKPVTIHQYKGRPLVISFGASWCGSCWRELESINKIKNNLPPEITFLVLSDEAPGRIDVLRQKFGHLATFLRLKQTFAHYGINTLPTTYIINSSLEVVSEQTGYTDWSDPSTLEHYKKLLEP